MSYVHYFGVEKDWVDAGLVGFNYSMIKKHNGNWQAAFAEIKKIGEELLPKLGYTKAKCEVSYMTADKFKTFSDFFSCIITGLGDVRDEKSKENAKHLPLVNFCVRSMGYESLTDLKSKWESPTAFLKSIDPEHGTIIDHDVEVEKLKKERYEKKKEEIKAEKKKKNMFDAGVFLANLFGVEKFTVLYTPEGLYLRGFELVDERIAAGNPQALLKVTDYIMDKIAGAIIRVDQSQYNRIFKGNELMRRLADISRRHDPLSDKLGELEAGYFEDGAIDKICDLLGLTRDIDRIKVRKWMYNSVAAMMTQPFNGMDISGNYLPSCVNDYFLILQGAQGLGKSEFCRKLLKGWQTYAATMDNIININDYNLKAGMITSQFVYCDEVTTFTPTRMEKIKQITSAPTVSIRFLYDRMNSERNKRCSFIGCANPQPLLTDKTGNRRFLICNVDISDESREFIYSEKEMNNLVFEAWAEAVFHVRTEAKVRVFTRDEEDQINKDNAQEAFETALQEEMSSYISDEGDKMLFGSNQNKLFEEFCKHANIAINQYQYDLMKKEFISYLKAKHPHALVRRKVKGVLGYGLIVHSKLGVDIEEEIPTTEQKQDSFSSVVAQVKDEVFTSKIKMYEVLAKKTGLHKNEVRAYLTQFYKVDMKKSSGNRSYMIVTA